MKNFLDSFTAFVLTVGLVGLVVLFFLVVGSVIFFVVQLPSFWGL